MKKTISNIYFSSCKDSKYIQPRRMHFLENGKERSWDIIEAHNSVAALLYHTQKDAFIIVKQFRPAVFLKEQECRSHIESELGYTYELCAGITDKNKPLEVIMQEEILEECGYTIALNQLHKITEFYSSVGFAGSKQTLFFAAVDENVRQNSGGGVDDENIEVIFIPRNIAEEFIFNPAYPKTSGVMFAFLWFFKNAESLGF